MSGTPGEFSLALAILRISRGWSQDQLARAAGVTNSALSEYERGKKIPELRSVRKLLDALAYPLSAVERTEDFLRELQTEGLLEARETPEGGHALVPVRAPLEATATPSASLRSRARRTAALMGQATTSFGLLLFDLLIGATRSHDE